MRDKRWWIAVACLWWNTLPGMAWGQPPDTGSDTENSQEAETPTLEFLEFLGDWETENGQWVDPIDLDQMALPDQEKDRDESKQ